MGNGQWAIMGNGQWAMGNGQWAMDFRQRKVIINLNIVSRSFTIDRSQLNCQLINCSPDTSINPVNSINGFRHLIN